MRSLARAALLLLLLALPAAADETALQSFARGLGLRDVAG